jgi:hypothetical protein
VCGASGSSESAPDYAFDTGAVVGLRDRFHAGQPNKHATQILCRACELSRSGASDETNRPRQSAFSDSSDSEVSERASGGPKPHIQISCLRAFHFSATGANIDWSQAKDLSKQNPKTLHELQRLWLIEAAKYNALPLDDRAGEPINLEIAGRPQLIEWASVR